MRARFDQVLEGIEAATTKAGFAAAFAENETMYRENVSCQAAAAAAAVSQRRDPVLP